ncbi:MAG: hypothetical protein KDC39_09605 [Actinobacteria bacterium]|nr:hypothetical protein [Actinomycetota bacterium]
MRSWRWGSELRKVLACAPELMPCAATDAALTRATAQQDGGQAIDYVARMQSAGVTVAVRVRSYRLLARYGGEFVLRDTATTRTTEAAKILTQASSADVYVYAFADPSDTHWVQWVLLDLTRLRRCWADGDRRHLLQVRRVPLAPGEHGMCFPLQPLIDLQVVLRARLAELGNGAHMEHVLNQIPEVQALDPLTRRAIADGLRQADPPTSLYLGPRRQLGA